MQIQVGNIVEAVIVTTKDAQPETLFYLVLKVISRDMFFCLPLQIGEIINSHEWEFNIRKEDMIEQIENSYHVTLLTTELIKAENCIKVLCTINNTLMKQILQSFVQFALNAYKEVDFMWQNKHNEFFEI